MYKITVKRTEQVTRPHQRWVQLAATGNERDGGPVYGYQDTTTIVEEETKILMQQVEELDLGALIKAINP